MSILVLNSGSSSLKYQLFDDKAAMVLLKGHIDGIGLSLCSVHSVVEGKESVKKVIVKNHVAAVKLALKIVDDVASLNDIKAIGHRVVHGGEYYRSAIKINQLVMKRIDKLSDLAPLHNPPNLAGIKACKKLLPRVPQVAVFDTAFHQTIPPEAYMYGIPYLYYKKYGIRKYGFHGTSHKYVMQEASRILKKKKINMVSCHLGNGSSITAIKNRRSIDTSMGFTPLPGIVMGTRSGDIDPEIVAFLEEKEHLTAEEVKTVLNKKSGLLGIAGSSDMRVVHDMAVKGDARAKLAIHILAYDIARYVASFAGIIGDIDAIVFTAGLGEHAYYLRERVIHYFNARHVILDAKRNRKSDLFISSSKSSTKVMVIPTNEELMIAKETKSVLQIR